MKKLLRYGDLSPEIEVDPSGHIYTVIQRNDREAMLFVINTSPEAQTAKLQFRRPSEGRLQPVLTPGADITIAAGKAEIPLQAGVVEVFRIIG
ncbi:MAG TPA: hypothetical protein VEC96_15570 [Anaerolineae bacterium]|nr:hypothetical protein [Anaerolineae bacterium]HXV99222.1 hypothetical protein [Anaerolineae bacterium]